MTRPYTVAESAALLHCSEYTIREDCRSGRLPGVKFGDDWVLPSGALFARLDEIAIEESVSRRKPAEAKALARGPAASARGSKAGMIRPVLPQLNQGTTT